RALLPRRQDNGDLRGDERDPAARDRALDTRPAGAASPRRLMARRRDEPVRLTRIYTRGGDRGETSLGDGTRVTKSDARISAGGAVDEVNAAVGLALAADVPEPMREELERIQNELFDLGADVSVPLEVEGR